MVEAVGRLVQDAGCGAGWGRQVARRRRPVLRPRWEPPAFPGGASGRRGFKAVTRSVTKSGAFLRRAKVSYQTSACSPSRAPRRRGRRLTREERHRRIDIGQFFDAGLETPMRATGGSSLHDIRHPRVSAVRLRGSLGPTASCSSSWPPRLRSLQAGVHRGRMGESCSRSFMMIVFWSS